MQPSQAGDIGDTWRLSSRWELQLWQPNADYFCQRSENTREIELSGRRVTVQCWRAEQPHYSSKARERNKHRQERAARDPGAGRTRETSLMCVWYPCQNQYGGGRITITVTATSGNAILLEGFQPLPSPSAS